MSNPQEIERKFICNLTRDEASKLAFDSRHIKSLYLETSKEASLRVVKDKHRDGSVKCFWTEKKSSENSIVRIEIEESLPEKIFDHLDIINKYPTIEKERFLIKVDNSIWEIDFFNNYDFVIAELEFRSLAEATAFNTFPSWIVQEVTEDPSYLNCNLAKLPLRETV